MPDNRTSAQPVRWLTGLAGLLGAVGVGSAAAGAHGDPRLMGSIATVCLGHAPALLALALFGFRTRMLMIAAVLLAGGTALFAADLMWRQAFGAALLPLLAPLSGGAMILGWLALLVGAIIWRDRHG